MKIYILLSEANRDKVEANFKQQKCVGVEFEFYTDFDQLMELIDARGFFMDKLVIISSMFKDWTDIQRQQLTHKLLHICETLDQSKEIFMLDSNQYFKNDFTTTLSFYPQVIYQSQKVEVRNLFGLITGDIVAPETPNINEGVKRQGFFGRIFNRGKGVQAQPVEEQPTEEQPQQMNEQPPEEMHDAEGDMPLFAADDGVQTMNEDTQTNEFVDDISDIFNSSTERPIIDNGMFQTSADGDMPLFEDPVPEPEPVPISEPEPMSIPQPEPEPIPEPMPRASLFKTAEPAQQPEPVIPAMPEPVPQKPKKMPKMRKEPKPAPAPTPTIKPSKSEYVKIFQKRTKLLLFTGERRSGISTVVSNCAAQAAADGLKVLLVDLDYERRGQAYNFPFIHDENDIKMTHSLYNANKNPSQIEEYAINLEPGLDFLGTSLAVVETNIMHQHVTDATLQRLLTLATSMYDIIFVDCPYEELREYPCLILLANTIIHSMNTDHRSIINTLNAITTDDFDSINSYNTYMAKVMMLLNNYKPHFWNGKEINERMLPIYITELIGDTTFQNVAVVGRIPSYDDYDYNMEDGKLLIHNKRYARDFVNILNEIAIRG